MSALSFLSTLKRTKKKPLENGINDLRNAALKIKSECDLSIEDAEITANQNRTLLKHLRSGRTITQPEAVNLYGIWRLGARVYDLRIKGIAIETIYESFGNRKIARYKLA